LASWKRFWRDRRAEDWRRRVHAALIPFLKHYITAITANIAPPAGAGNPLREVLRTPLPTDWQGETMPLASAFRKLDLTPHDVLTLTKQFIARYPDRQQPVLAAGLRTAGTYFAPLFRALLESEG